MNTVCVLGKGDLAARIAAWFLESEEYRLVEVVPVVPEPSWTASLADWAARAGVPCVQSGDYRDGAAAYDLVFSVFYEKIFAADWLVAQGRALNLHNGPLPRYRGVNPINWALMNGERSHGVTIHEMSPGIDTGPIVAQVEYSIYPEFDEVADVYARALDYGWALFAQTMPILDRIEARPQDELAATSYTRDDYALLGNRGGWRRS
jgi:methionyl-tRNA formyltransferase